MLFHSYRIVVLESQLVGNPFVFDSKLNLQHTVEHEEFHRRIEQKRLHWMRMDGTIRFLLIERGMG